jgi:hypothetical protein
MPGMTRPPVVFLALALAACPKPAPAPAPPSAPPAGPDAAVAVLPLDQDLPRLAARAVQLYQEVARVFAATGTDCAAAASKLRELRPTYAEVTTASAKVLHDGRAKDMRAALEPHAEALDAAGKAIATSQTMASCSSDRVFTAAFDEVIGAPP